MTSSELAQMCSPLGPIEGPWPRQETMAPAAPSPNRAVATTFAIDRSVLWKHREQSSTTSNSIGRCAGQGSGASKPEHAIGAAESENRQSFHVPAKRESFHQQGVKA